MLAFLCRDAHFLTIGVSDSQAADQWPQPQWRCVSRGDGLDLLGYVLVAVFQRRLVHDDRFASGRRDRRQAAPMMPCEFPYRPQDD